MKSESNCSDIRKKMKIISKKYLLLILAAFVLVACDTADTKCREDVSVKLKAGFYTIKDNKATSLSVDSITLKGLNVDSVLYKNSKSVSSVSLPLNALASESVFEFLCNDIKDTVAVSYTTNDAYFISLGCGCIAKHTISKISYTTHYIDSVQLIYPDVLNVDIEHVKIYHN